MTSMGTRRTLVVGGGIAGMSFAIAARRQGVDVDVVEIEPRVVGVGIFLTGSTLRALDSIGLAHDCVRHGWAVPSLRLHTADGMLIADNPMPQIAAPDLPASCAIRRPTLAAIFAGAAERAGARVRVGITVEAIHDTGRTVQVRFSDGSSGDYDVLVGADGIYSQVRRLVFGSHLRPVHTGQGSWRFMTPRHPAVDRMLFFASEDRKSVV